MTTVLIAGGSGLIGTALAHHLRGRGDRAIILTRSPRGFVSERQWDPSHAWLPTEALQDVDAVVNLAGAGIGDRRWTRARKVELLTSRTGPTRTLASAIARHNADGGHIRTLVQGSAIGYYGDRPGEILDEGSTAGDGFIPELVTRWEAATAPAREQAVPVAFARTGLVLTPDGGALAKLLPLIRLGAGGPFGAGEQMWSWITLRDEVRALASLVDDPHDGPVNLTAPNPVSNGELVRAYAAALHRPAKLSVPEFALRLGVGGFAGELLASQNVHPGVLLERGLPYRDATIEDAAKLVQ
ncbi:TIGR01777 family oxidoreductase [Rarobacter faecitabidus]|uniref:TIGR01777 family protein n=1 Tax=Rarobacter faecitabidus TaxID=13243 RepID=A0A542ZV86_RARFA|nr:TIGR01777 family oxidoreductase [Rarobacter faecitabidus]TQL64275.1 hypothetical protein FB461_0773 [Rarobacter faecitabidus]